MSLTPWGLRIFTHSLSLLFRPLLFASFYILYLRPLNGNAITLHPPQCFSVSAAVHFIIALPSGNICPTILIALFSLLAGWWQCRIHFSATDPLGHLIEH